MEGRSHGSANQQPTLVPDPDKTTPGSPRRREPAAAAFRVLPAAEARQDRGAAVSRLPLHTPRSTTGQLVSHSFDPRRGSGDLVRRRADTGPGRTDRAIARAPRGPGRETEIPARRARATSWRQLPGAGSDLRQRRWRRTLGDTAEPPATRAESPRADAVPQPLRTIGARHGLPHRVRFDHEDPASA